MYLVATASIVIFVGLLAFWASPLHRKVLNAVRDRSESKLYWVFAKFVPLLFSVGLIVFVAGGFFMPSGGGPARPGSDEYKRRRSADFHKAKIHADQMAQALYRENAEYVKRTSGGN